ncbi:MAG: Hpt domain-containing protein [Labilithrix sp.]|nr:Hpt domain-containing protein [Labilithrix sp.]MCW5810555.1 Hpt domain-containing protein [Labilithrix sp.]
MSARDPELTQILVQELERHLVALRGMTDGDLDAARRTVHALKGSAGLAGEPELASTMASHERRLRAGESAALGEVIATVARAIERIRAGESGAAAEWPEPPPELAPSAIDPEIRPRYAVEVTDRLARIDAVLTGEGAHPEESAAELFRHVHTLKGAASAAGDEPMSWFCHGLEGRLRGAAPEAAIEEVAGWRAVLGALADDPEAALATLRGVPLRPRRATQRPRAEAEGDGTIRVAAQAVDSLLDHAAGIAVARERVAARSSGAMDHARTLRRLRGDLVEALRLIGPPRPWGAPAAALRRVERAADALTRMSDELEVVAERLQETGQALRDDVGASRKLLSAMRQTPIRGLFTRVAAAVSAEARRTGRVVLVRTVGGDELVDRRLVEALAEPCLQLARNAIAHGIEEPAARAALGKPPAATLTLSATRTGNRLAISIADDGAGVDVAAVRARAVEAGAVTDTFASRADDQTLLEILFLPGFSTRSQSPDLLAGRGIGLDITLASVERLGGAIRLSSERGHGFEARVEVPIESGLVTVLWVVVADVHLALPAANARRVRPNDDPAIPHLAACLEAGVLTRAPLAVDLDAGGEPFAIGVDAVGLTEEVLVRPLSPLLSGVGPYAGALVRGDGSVHLALDVHALAPRARALGRVGPPSDAVGIIAAPD